MAKQSNNGKLTNNRKKPTFKQWQSNQTVAKQSNNGIQTNNNTMVKQWKAIEREKTKQYILMLGKFVDFTLAANNQFNVAWHGLVNWHNFSAIIISVISHFLWDFWDSEQTQSDLWGKVIQQKGSKSSNYTGCQKQNTKTEKPAQFSRTVHHLLDSYSRVPGGWNPPWQWHWI